MSEGGSAGELLAAARTASRMTVDEVGAATRLRSQVVAAMERDDFSLCGGDFYARAHIRAIAQVVGADPAAMLAAFDEAPDPVRSEPEVGRDRIPVSSGSRRPRPRWAVAAGLVMVAIVAVLLGGRFIGHGSSVSPGQRALTTAPPGGRSGARPTPHRPAPGSTTAVRAQVTATNTRPGTSGQVGVRLALRAARGSSWVTVSAASGTTLWQGILAAGERREFSDATRLTVHYGTAGSVNASVNGRLLGRPCPAEVCTVVYTPASGEN